MTREARADCPLCGGTAGRAAYPARLAFPDAPDGRMDLVRCRRCTALYANPMPDAQRLAALYDDPAYFDSEFSSGQITGGYDAAKPHYERQARRLDALLRPTHPQRGTLLEVGAAGGLLLEAMRNLGWQVEGVELSPRQRASTEARLGIALAETVGQLPLERRYDAIVMMHTLEHFTDPASQLRDLARRLAPGGVMVLEVPATLNHPLFHTMARMRRSWSTPPPRVKSLLAALRLIGPDETLAPYHLVEFNGRSLSRLLTSCGLEPLRMEGEMPRPDAIANGGPAPLRLAFAALQTVNRLGLGIYGNLRVVARPQSAGAG